MAAQSFGQLLKSFRLARGLTQEALAALGSTSPASISSYEEGRRVPDASVVDRLAAALQLGPDDHNLLRQTAGLRGLPGDFESALKRGRGPVDTVWDEVQATPWVTLIVNERREIIQSFTRRGIKKLPDGRKVEDIVHTPQSWSKRKQ